MHRQMGFKEFKYWHVHVCVFFEHVGPFNINRKIEQDQQKWSNILDLLDVAFYEKKKSHFIGIKWKISLKSDFHVTSIKTKDK